MRRANKRKAIKKSEFTLLLILLIGTILFFPTLLISGETASTMQEITVPEDENIQSGNLDHMDSYKESQEDQDEKITTSSEKEDGEEVEEFSLSEDVGDEEPASQGKVIYLTFDDGPNNATEELLDVLEDYQVKATFFMLEPLIKNKEDLVKRMIDSGHAAALHGVTHDINQFYASEQSVVAEMLKAQQAVLEATGTNTNLIRTPYGSAPKMITAYKQAIKKEGFILWDWNVDSMDWYYRGSGYVQETLNQIKKVEQNDQPPVVLMHDLKTTVEYLPILLDTLIEEGYSFKGLSEGMNPVQF